MTADALPTSTADLFSHVTAEKAALYRAVMQTFVAAKRQFRLHLRPHEVMEEAHWPAAPPSMDELQSSLSQLVDWGNLHAQPDTARVMTVEDFYRKRLLYRMTAGGEAVEAALQVFADTLGRRAELQSVALEDIRMRLLALRELAQGSPLDAAKVHGALRDLVNVFESLANNAEAFMAGLARTIELQRAELGAVLSFKARLLDYLQRFIGDLVMRSSQISAHIAELEPWIPELLRAAAERDARDAAPGDAETAAAVVETRLAAWQERWIGLARWFVSDGHTRAQSELLRSSALSAIPRLLQAVSLLNERRSGRSDRAADFRRLAFWFAETRTGDDAHRLWRAAFALSPARHLAIAITDAKAAPGTSWRDAPGASIHPKLREQGALSPRGAPPKIIDRSRERALLAERVALEAEQTEAARRRLATNRETRLSELGVLDIRSFRLFISLLGDALAAQRDPDAPVERLSGDGSLLVRLEPLEPDSHAEIETEIGRFSGRDHRLLIRET